jgi:hypothetical protein
VAFVAGGEEYWRQNRRLARADWSRPQVLSKGFLGGYT